MSQSASLYAVYKINSNQEQNLVFPVQTVRDYAV